MKRFFIALLVGVLVFSWVTPTRAQLLSGLLSPTSSTNTSSTNTGSSNNRIIVRTSGLSLLQLDCLILGCTVAGSLDGGLGQLFLVTVPLGTDLTNFINLLLGLTGIVDAEVDHLLTVSPGIVSPPNPPTGLSQRWSVSYYGTSVWQGYATQPATQLIRLQNAEQNFHATGSGIVADIDTGVDFNHPALKGVLLPGYDFTRNQPYANEVADLAPGNYQGPQGQPAIVNQSTAAIVDQSTAALVDGAPYAAFGHGTMVAGVIHLVAPKATILPLKAFGANGQGNLSDILHALYYAVQNHARVINMSFDFTSYSGEMARAIKYANSKGLICVASAGNEGKDEVVYPAALSGVMDVASTSDIDSRSYFSNYGQGLIWVTAPGEQIVTTYPFASYAAGSGTSFSAPFVSGTAALILQLNSSANQSLASSAVAHAKPLTSELGHGRLDVNCALQALSNPPASCVE